LGLGRNEYFTIESGGFCLILACTLAFLVTHFRSSLGERIYHTHFTGSFGIGKGKDGMRTIEIELDTQMDEDDILGRGGDI
jgi:hypothetical protein